jgi:hypothetical protein
MHSANFSIDATSQAQVHRQRTRRRERQRLLRGQILWLTGRFMSPDTDDPFDPISYANPTNPQSLNLYGYVLNNPLTNTDADGHDVSICPPGATGITSSCQTISNDQYQAALQGNNGGLSLPSLQSLQQNGSGTARANATRPSTAGVLSAGS